MPVQSSSFPVTELVAAMPNNNMVSNRFKGADPSPQHKQTNKQAEAGQSHETKKNLKQKHRKKDTHTHKATYGGGSTT